MTQNCHMECEARPFFLVWHTSHTYVYERSYMMKGAMKTSCNETSTMDPTLATALAMTAGPNQGKSQMNTCNENR